MQIESDLHSITWGLKPLLSYSELWKGERIVMDATEEPDDDSEDTEMKIEIEAEPSTVVAVEEQRPSTDLLTYIGPNEPSWFMPIYSIARQGVTWSTVEQKSVTPDEKLYFLQNPRTDDEHKKWRDAALTYRKCLLTKLGVGNIATIDQSMVYDFKVTTRETSSNVSYIAWATQSPISGEWLLVASSRFDSVRDTAEITDDQLLDILLDSFSPNDIRCPARSTTCLMLLGDTGGTQPDAGMPVLNFNTSTHPEILACCIMDTSVLLTTAMCLLAQTKPPSSGNHPLYRAVVMYANHGHHCVSNELGMSDPEFWRVYLKIYSMCWKDSEAPQDREMLSTLRESYVHQVRYEAKTEQFVLSPFTDRAETIAVTLRKMNIPVICPQPTISSTQGRSRRRRRLYGCSNCCSSHFSRLRHL